MGQVSYTDLKHPRRALAINLAVADEAVTDLRTEEELEKWASALVFRILLQVPLRHIGKGHASEATTVEDGAAP